MVFPVVGGNQSSGDLITNSLRLSKDSTTNIYRDFSSTGTLNTKGTFSWWCKIYQQSNDMYMLTVREDATPAEHIHIRYQNPMIQGQFYESSSQYAQIVTNDYFRDHSAWYHFVLKMDSTDGTANNRIRLFVNNQEVSYATQSMPNQNQDFIISKVSTHLYGNTYWGTGNHLDGGLAYVHFIDGQAKDPTDFGETNDNGVWIPKEYEGTYGDHGYKLEFKQTGTSQNASGIGADTSGNGNHFAVTGLSSIDVTTDTPQNNFCTFNSLYASNTQTNGYVTTLSEGNLRAVSTAAGKSSGISSFGVANGKWYAEFKQIAFSSSNSKNYSLLGVHSDLTPMLHNNPNGTGVLGYSPHGYAYWGWNADGSTAGYKMNDDDSSSTYGDAWGVNDIIGIALDLDNNAIYVSKNGTWQASSDPESGASRTNAMYNLTAASSTPDGLYFMVVGDSGSSQTGTWEANFGNAPFSISSGNSDGNGYGNFEYAVPSGYYSLCTKNLAEYG